MNKVDLTQAISIIANIGVIGGLIFVGFQLRQDREIAIVDSVQAATDTRASWSESLAVNGDVWARGLVDEELTHEESVRFDVLADVHQLYYFGNWLRNERIGTRSAQERWVREMAVDLVENPGLRQWWTRYLERVAVTAPDDYDDEWTAAVNREIDRLEGRTE